MTVEPEKVTWTGHDRYFKLVDKNMARIETLYFERENFPFRIRGRPISDHDIEVIVATNDEIANSVIVFSALTLKVYINHYVITRISGNYFSKYLDELDLVTNWIIILKVVTGYQLNPGSTTMQELD